jgi:anaerobic selenocysteine-containing dehydrogenase
VCNFCHVRCPALVHVEDGRVVRVEADQEHPFGGLICVKGRAAGELRDHPDRLLYPLKRIGPKARTTSTADDETMWRRVSWDEALDDIAQRLLAIRAAHGPESIVFSKGTKSGTGLVDAERWLKRLSNVIGTPNTVSTTHLCQWPRDEGTRYTYGVRMPTPDLERSGVYLLWGCNPSATNIRMAAEIQTARAHGMKLITVDPRRVGLATQSDLHLAVQPGTDGALALSIAQVLVEHGWIDEPFIQQWTNAPFLVRRDTGQLLRWSELGDEPPMLDSSEATTHTGRPADSTDRQSREDSSPERDGYVVWASEPTRVDEGGAYVDRRGNVVEPELDATPTVRLADGSRAETETVFHQLRALLAEYPPERAAEITDVPAEDIRAAAELLGRNRPAAHYFWNGITQHTNAAQNGRAISVLYALLGDFDAPGGNVLTPRPAINDVELNSVLGSAENEKRLGWAERPLGAARTSASSAAYDLYRAITDAEPYQARALLAFGNNMVMSSGSSREGRDALAQLELMVAVDHFLTPTAQLADYVLPATTFLEAPALCAGWELPLPAQTHIQYRAAVLPARGEARSDTQIIFDLATRLGFGDRFWDGDLDAAFAHELEPAGISLDALKGKPVGIQSKPVAGPPSGRSHTRPTESGAPRGFNTPTRKIEIFATLFAREGQDPLPRYSPPRWSPQRDPALHEAYPFVLTNAKVAQFVHGQHRGLPSLRRVRPHPEVEMHPDTAASAGVASGMWVTVETPEGAVRARVRTTSAVKPGVVVGQHGWWQACADLELPGYSPYAAEGSNVNLLVSNEWRDPISGGTPFRSARCRLRPVEPPAD